MPGGRLGGACRRAGLAAATALLASAVVALPTPPASAERIFFRGETWLETSPSVQHLSLVGVLRAWERIAREALSVAGPALSRREREAIRLYDCLLAPSPRPVDELLRVVTAFGAKDPERVFYSLSDFIGEGLRQLCPASGGSEPADDPARG